MHLPDHVLTIHYERQRSLEAEARQAALASQALRAGRKPRRLIPRLRATARRASTSARTAPSP